MWRGRDRWGYGKVLGEEGNIVTRLSGTRKGCPYISCRTIGGKCRGTPCGRPALVVLDRRGGRPVIMTPDRWLSTPLAVAKPTVVSQLIAAAW
jgi:hypothetical protein